MVQYSIALEDYRSAFADPAEPFLACYSLNHDGIIEPKVLTRGMLWSLARKAAFVIRQNGLGQGDCFAHYFSGNHYADLAFRLGATMAGAIPVTINWQDITIESISFKIALTESRLLVTDSGVQRKLLNRLLAHQPELAEFSVEDLSAQPELPEDEFCCDDSLNHDATRIVVFTSGTTGQPRGVCLSYKNYATNRNTFESFLQIHDEDRFALLVVNPMHHANSTAVTDWALRRPGTQLHLIERYSSRFWSLLADIVRQNRGRIVAPMVSRHFDFLENLLQESRLSVEPDVLKNAMRRVEFLLGSAPVGPFTVGRLQRYTGRVPIVRFGSTETCLQVIGTPLTLSEKQTLAAFRRGWFHQWNGEKHPGYYVGRPHPPYTECRIVRSVMPGSPHYFVDCEEGEPGYLIARGGNVMQKYVKNDVDTHKVLHDGGWYTGFGDICFWRADDADAKRDYYWVSRESALLIRGGANYAYAQVNSELKEFVKKRYGLPYEAFDVAVVGLRLQSEHEDDCCVFMELLSPEAVAKQDEIEKTFLTEAQANVSKGARPDRLLFQKIPRNYKGEIVVPQLKKAYSQLSDIGS